MLVIFGGLPGVGKTTIAKKVAHAINAVYLRIDTIEAAITTSQLGIKKTEDAGYLAAYGIARDNLAIGHTVVADSVNPIAITRKAWQEVACALNKQYIEIEIVCSNKAMHKHRVETRSADLKNHELPTWEEVLKRNYQIWKSATIRLDTAYQSANECAEQIVDFIFRSGLE